MDRILLCLALLVSSFATQAQEAWPTRPVKFIVPSSPGGGTDVYARILAQALRIAEAAVHRRQPPRRERQHRRRGGRQVGSRWLHVPRVGQPGARGQPEPL